MGTENDHCTECGMADAFGEYHPHALCLLVKARGGNTTAARQDMQAIIASARSNEPWVADRVNRFLANEGRRARA